MAPEVASTTKYLSKQLTDSDVSIMNVFGKLFDFKIYNNWKILLYGKTDCRNLSWRADAENYIQYVGKAETTERTTCNKREGFNFVYFP